MTPRRARWHRWLRVTEWALGILLVTAGLWIVRTTSELSGVIQASVEETFAEQAQGTLTIDDTYLRWGYVEFEGLVARTPFLPGTLSVRSIRVDISYWGYVAGGFSAESAVTDVTISSPRLDATDPLSEWLARLQLDLSDTPSTWRPGFGIELHDGAVIHRADGDGLGDIGLVEHLTARYYPRSQAINLSAAFLSDSTNLNARVRIPAGESPRFTAVARGIGFGSLRGASIASMGGTADVFASYVDSLDASISLSNLTFVSRDGLRAGPANLTLRATDTAVSWERASVPLGGLEVVTQGHVDWADSLRVDASLFWTGDVERIGSLAGADLAGLRGNVEGFISLAGPLRRPVLSARIVSDTLHTDFAELRDVNVTCHTEAKRGILPDTLILDAMTLRLDGATVRGTGGGRLDTLDLRLAIRSSDIDLSRLRSFAGEGNAGTARLAGHIRTTAFGTTAGLQLRLADLRYRGTPVPLTFVEFQRDSAGTSTVYAAGESGSLEGRVFPHGDTASAQPLFAGNLRLQGLALPLADSSSAPWLTGSLSVLVEEDGLSVEGPLEIGTEFLAPVPAYASLGLSYADTTAVDSTDAPRLVLTVNSPGIPLGNGFEPDVDVTVRRVTGGWSVSGRAWHDAAEFRVSVSDSGRLAGEANLASAPVLDLTRFVRADRSIPGGSISGHAVIAGTLDSLAAEGALRLTDFTLRAMDSLDVTIPFSVTPDSIVWRRAPWMRNGVALAEAGGYHSIGGETFARVTNPGECGPLSAPLTLGGTGLSAEGRSQWSVEVRHNEQEGLSLDMRVDATDGHLMNFPFDTCTAHVYGGAEWLTIDAELHKHGEYEAHCRSGRIPIGPIPDRELDLPITVPAESGHNVLGLLLHIIDQGVTGEGPGSAFIRVAGSGSNAVIGGGWIEFHDGTLHWPTATWPDWRNVSGRAEVPAGTRFISITEFSANVGDGRVTATNSPASSVGAEPLPVEEVGLSLGIVKVRTPRAIPLHIPGGMQRGEYLDMKARGVGDLQDFTFAGPWEHPLAIGEIELADGYFTYPPYEDPDRDTTHTVVERINWQVDIVAGRDLYYQTQSTPENFWLTMLKDPLEILGSMAADLEARLVEGGRLHVWGVYEDSTLNIRTDNIVSHQARMSVLNIDMQPDGPLELRWDTRQDPDPILRGRGVASLGDSVNIYARLVTIDPQTRAVREGGKLGELTVELDSDEFLGDVSQQEKQLAILRMLGFYSGDRQTQQLQPKEIGSAAYRAVLRRSEQQAWRMMLRPFQRELRRLTTIDVLQVEPSFVINLLEVDRPESQLAYLQGTNWTVGEYFWDRLLVSYQGELEVTSLDRPILGARHSVGVEWAINPGTRLAVSRDIDVPYGVPDTRFSINHRFTFQSY